MDEYLFSLLLFFLDTQTVSSMLVIRTEDLYLFLFLFFGFFLLLGLTLHFTPCQPSKKGILQDKNRPRLSPSLVSHGSHALG